MIPRTFIITLAMLSTAGIAVGQWQQPTTGKKTPAKATPAARKAAHSGAGAGKAAPVMIEMDGSYETKGSGASGASGEEMGVALASSVRELQRLENVVGIGAPEYIKEYMNYSMAYEAEKKRLGGKLPTYEKPKPPSDEGMKRMMEQKRQEAIARQDAEAKQQMQQQLNAEMMKQQKELEKQGFSDFTSGTRSLK